MGLETEPGAKTKPIKLSTNKFSDHIVVVTGGAQGIGLCTAQLFAAQGATVVLVDIQEQSLKEVSSDIQQKGGKCAFRVCNLTDEKEVATTVQSIISEFSRIDVLAHIAGIYPFHPFVDYPTETYHRIMSVNVDATFFITRAVLPQMQSQGYGRIVLTSSSTFQDPQAGLSVYVASKAAVIGFTRAVAREAGPGITVNVVLPGLIKTSTTWDAGVQPDGSHPFFEQLIKRQIVKRCGLPEDVAHSMCFLASPEASFITGQILDVSGGETLH